MHFTDLSNRLLARLRRLVDSGTVSENALAKRLGISQPHLHNTLKGVRSLTIGAADKILTSMHWTVWDLTDDEELQAESRRRKSPKSKIRELPLQLLPAQEKPFAAHLTQVVPRSALAGVAKPALFEIGAGVDTAGIANCAEILLGDLEQSTIRHDAVYLVRIEGVYRLCCARQSGRALYLIHPDDWLCPLRWARVEHAEVIARILGIVKRSGEEFRPLFAPRAKN